MIAKSLIEQLVTDYCSSKHPNYYIVDIAVHPGNRIVVELGADEGISIDSCVLLTKHIEGHLDREVEDFELEVGSAGLTSPFKVLRQYQGAIDQELEVLRKGGIKEKGHLTAVSAEAITLTVVRMQRPEGAKRKVAVEESILIPMEEVLQAKRILSF